MEVVMNTYIKKIQNKQQFVQQTPAYSLTEGKHYNLLHPYHHSLKPQKPWHSLHITSELGYKKFWKPLIESKFCLSKLVNTAQPDMPGAHKAANLKNFGSPVSLSFLQ